MAKRWSEGHMQRAAWYWHRAQSNPPPGCLWRLWRSASTLTQPFCPDGYVFCWWSNYNKTFQGWFSSFAVLYISCVTLPHWIVQFQEHLSTWKTKLTFAMRCIKTPQWILSSQLQEYRVVIPTQYKDLNSYADFIDGFLWAVKQTEIIHSIPVRGIVGPVHFVWVTAPLDRINGVWVVTNHVDLDTH